MEFWSIDIGDTVVCDFCNRDYTESNDKGGLIVGGYAVCPRCERIDMLKDVDYVSMSGESFKDFVVRTRVHSTIGVCSW
jgi:hypothetical protein